MSNAFSKINASSIFCGLCLLITLDPIASLAALLISLFFKNVYIVDFGMPYFDARSETRTPFSCSAMISFFTPNVALVVFCTLFRKHDWGVPEI